MTTAVLAIVVVLLVLLVLGVAGFFLFAPGPRRWRAYHRASKALAADDWETALTGAESMLPEVKGNAAWQTRVKNLAGEAHQRAVDHALKAREFDVALEHALSAADHLGLDPDEQRGRVTEAMLAETRRLFAAGPDKDEATRAMVARTRKVTGAVPPESMFW